MKLSIIFAVLMASAVATLPPVPSKRYRSDYEYNEKSDAFYKLHTETADTLTASRRCAEEGAELATISSDEDVTQIFDMMYRINMKDSVMVASQASPDNVASRDQCSVINYYGEIESSDTLTHRPFACKVEAQNAPYNEECGVYGYDYQSRISTTGSCYKVSTSEVTWDEASADCQAEGAHLVILNNVKELEVVKKILMQKSHHSETQYFAGVKAASRGKARVFKTVYHQTLGEVGYRPWEDGEPSDWRGGEYCVALDMRRHGRYNDVWCYLKMKYVCESTGTGNGVHLRASVILPMCIALLSVIFF